MNKYQVRQSLHRAPLAVAVGSVLAAGAARNAHAQNIVVTTNADAPAGTITTDCTLRDAVESATTVSAVGGCDAGNNALDVIGFDPGLAESTITLAHGEMPISHGGYLYFYGPEEKSPAGITIDAGEDSRIFRFQDGSRVTLRDMTLQNGRTAGDSERGGAVAAYDTDLALERVHVKYSSTSGMFSSGGGVYLNGGNLEVTDSFLYQNATAGDYASGGGLYVGNGDLSLSDSLVRGNLSFGYLAHGAGLRVVGGDANLNGSTVSENINFGGYANGGGLNVQSGNLAITGGAVSENQTVDNYGYGGGVFVNSGDAALTGVTISGNSTAGDNAGGGGLASFFGELSLTGTTISENFTEGAEAHGGGLFMGGGIDASLTVENSHITGNSAVDGSQANGGGLYIRNVNNTVARLEDSRVSGNDAASRGGGLYVRNAGNNGGIILRETEASGNSALLGGGVYVHNDGTTLSNPTLVENSSISDNTANNGGGLLVINGDATLNGSTVSGNTANYIGGGVYVDNLPDVVNKHAVLTNTTLSGNSTGLYGSGLVGRNADMTVTHGTLVGNNIVEALGGADGSVMLNNSLVVAAAGESACYLYESNPFAYVNTLVTDDSCTGQATDPAALSIAAFQDNGGPTETHALGAGSVAIDGAGDCSADFEIDTDQRGLSRPGGDSSACDIGAFEVQGGAGDDLIFQDRFEE